MAIIVPSTLLNVPNGKLPVFLLSEVTLPGIRSGGMAFRNAAKAFTAMQLIAKTELGLELTASSSPYRSWQQQYELFVSRYKPVSYARYLMLGSAKRKRWNDAKSFGHASIYWELVSGAMAAVPGTSNHGLGMAIDAAWFINGRIVPITAHTAGYAWFKRVTNDGSFGFKQSSIEAWHIDYVLGDGLPEIVKQMDAFFAAPPAPPLPAPAPSKPDYLPEGLSGNLVVGSLNRSDIMAWQAFLNEYVTATVIDGVYGPATADKTRGFQAFWKLPVTGIVDADTWNAGRFVESLS